MTKPAWLALAFIVVLFGGAAVFFGPLMLPSVHEGVTVEGVAVGGKSREEVRQLVEIWRQEYRGHRVTVYFGDITFSLAAGQIDYDLDAAATAEEAYAVGRRGSLWQRLQAIRAASSNGARLPARTTYSESKLAAIVADWQQAIDRPPRNAAFSLSEGGIVAQELGRRLETEALRPLLMGALAKKEQANLPLPVTPLYPAVTAADLRQSGLKDIWATFATFFDAGDVNRSANIRLAARQINGHIVYPGQGFSFNEVVGPRDREHGFKEALEIVDGEFVPGIGGGICQVSSTLYNVVLLANLAIAERTSHSRPLGYVGLGRDATVVYGLLDFRFANDSGGPVMLLAETAGNKLTVGVVGDRPLTVKVDIVSADRRIIPPAVVKKQDPELYLGEVRQDKQGKPGYEITTYRVVSAGGREVKRELLARDRYPPDNTIVKVGTRVPAAQPFTGSGPAEK